MAEPIVIILQTYRRTDVALRTVAAARAFLRYPELYWYVADDGSPAAHVDAVLAALGDASVAGWHTQRRGYGGNANAAWDVAGKVGALTLWLEDDWELRAPLDLYPYAALLMEREDVAMVRLGYLNPGLRAQSIAHGPHHQMYWAFDREPAHGHEIVFTGHPSLRHRRYREAYGDYPTRLPPGETELAYAYRFRIGSGPAIVWPADYPPGGMFHHIGSVKTEDLL